MLRRDCAALKMPGKIKLWFRDYEVKVQNNFVDLECHYAQLSERKPNSSVSFETQYSVENQMDTIGLATAFFSNPSLKADSNTGSIFIEMYLLCEEII